jgi:hypothetical protein
MRNVLNKSSRENKNTHIIFFKSIVFRASLCDINDKLPTNVLQYFFIIHMVSEDDALCVETRRTKQQVCHSLSYI